MPSVFLNLSLLLNQTTREVREEIENRDWGETPLYASLKAPQTLA